MPGWLVKSEPEDWSFDDQMGVDTEPWTGVRNAQAQKNMRSMALGDPVLFYHSGGAREIVGLCSVSRTTYPDPSDESGKYILVDLKGIAHSKTPLSLKAVKADGRFDHLALVRQPRLSVMPIDDDSFKSLLALAGIET